MKRLLLALAVTLLLAACDNVTLTTCRPQYTWTWRRDIPVFPCRVYVEHAGHLWDFGGPDELGCWRDGHDEPGTSAAWLDHGLITGDCR